MERAALAAIAAMLSLPATPANAQVITLGQALKAPEPAQQSEAVKQVVPKREPASAHLSAIYGRSPGLRASVTLNGVTTEAQAGDVLRAGSTACRLARIELSARCVVLAQSSRSGDICPTRVCWTGEPPPAEPEVEVARPSRDLGMPPVPVPSPSNAKR
jgi:hypothetical protein